MNEVLAKKIGQILDTFARECMGNRLNQFSLLSLKEIILNEIKAYKPTANQTVVVNQKVKKANS